MRREGLQSPDRGSEEGLRITPGTILNISPTEKGAFIGWDSKGEGEAIFSRVDQNDTPTGEEARLSGPDEVRRLNPDYVPPVDEPVDFTRLRDIEEEDEAEAA